METGSIYFFCKNSVEYMVSVHFMAIKKTTPLKETWYIYAISSNLIAELSGDSVEAAERYNMECLHRGNVRVRKNLYEVPEHVANAVYTRRNDFHFILYKQVEGSLPRFVCENFPRPPKDPFKKHVRNLKKGVIKGSSLLRRQNREKARR